MKRSISIPTDALWQAGFLLLRKERGYTQKTFAQELSVTERCIRAYENETRHPDYFGLIALADYFNVSLDYLVGRSDRRERNP